MRFPTKSVFALSLSTLVLGGCVVVPIDSEGRPIYTPAPPAYSPSGAPVNPVPRAVSLPVRLYPANNIATETGVVTGVVTNMMTGKGRFNLNYRGDTLTGEATRVSGDERRGLASAYSPSGAYMSCEYQMNTPRKGAGTCTFSNGAKYKLHVGS
jgi:hypothetical protein